MAEGDSHQEDLFSTTANDTGFYLEKLENLLQVCESTTWSANYEDIYQCIASALVLNLDCDYANIYLIDVGGENMTTYASHSMQPDYRTADKTAVTTKPTVLGRLLRMIETKQPIMMDYRDPHPCDQIPPNATEQGFEAAITVPLIAADEVFGIYNLVYKHPKKWSDLELIYLKAIGRLLGVNIHRAQMSRKIVEMQILNERKFLSSEIHDNLAQSVSSLKIGAETSLMFLDRGDIAGLRESLERLETIGLQAVKTLREEMLSLRISQSETKGLAVSVKETLALFRDKWAIETELIVDESSEPRVTIQTELQLMRILHESLTNVLRHANATKVEVTLKQVERKLHMHIEDNGRGFDTSTVSSERLGIRIMKERAESVGGSCSIESEAGEWTRVMVETPSII